jgi:hypothetical protein
MKLDDMKHKEYADHVSQTQNQNDLYRQKKGEMFDEKLDKVGQLL